MTDSLNLELPAQLDMVYAEQLKGGLCGAVERGHSIHLDASDVQQVGTSCIQLMVAASRALEGGDAVLVLANAPPCLSEALNDLGFHDELQKWSASDD